MAMDFSLLDTGLVWATRRKVEEASLHCPLYAADIPVWLMVRGAVTLRYADEETAARAGQWLMPKQGAAWHDFSDDAEIVSLRFRLCWMNREEVFERTRTLLLDDPADGKLCETAEALVAQSLAVSPLAPDAEVSRHLGRQAAFFRWLEIYTETLRHAGVRSRVVGETDARLVAAREWLDAAKLDQRISRHALARHVGWSLTQLNRRFSAEYGMTPRQYFEQRRLSRARLELMRERWTIKETAAALGFTDLAQFSNWFSRHTNQAPRSYRGRPGI